MTRDSKNRAPKITQNAFAKSIDSSQVDTALYIDTSFKKQKNMQALVCTLSASVKLMDRENTFWDIFWSTALNSFRNNTGPRKNRRRD